MAFPVVESVTEATFGADATAHLVTMPATVNAGDLLIVLFANDGTATVTTPANWNLLGSTSSTDRISEYYKIAVGNEDGTTVDFVTSASEQAVSQVYRISAWHGTTPPEIGTAATGSSTLPNPPALTPSWGAADTEWLAIAAWPGGGTTVSVYPTDYTDGVDTIVSAGAGSGVGSARRQLNATSDNPGTFTLSVSSAWIAQTLAIRPAAAADQALTGVLFTSAPTFPQGALSQAPAAPANLAATGTGLTTVDVVWDNVAAETGFRIERSPNGTTGWSTAGTNAANDLTFTDSGLTCGTTYFYRVYATNGSGDSAASNTDSAVTDACPAPPPNTGGNRMGGSGAIRKPPRNVGR